MHTLGGKEMDGHLIPFNINDDTGALNGRLEHQTCFPDFPGASIREGVQFCQRLPSHRSACATHKLRECKVVANKQLQSVRVLMQHVTKKT